MTRIVTGKFNTAAAAYNAYEDFVGTGFPDEKLFHAKDSTEVKVITSLEGEPEVREILGRHQPTEVYEHST
ncbi:hypothetical protein EDD52_1428 [Primorskyibacter sedentarius]|uniref:Uncharacterized protein n=1 Tax=Primorskyibacter sedentarius TaxID=745311 RepID=A0A4R3IPT6_9RHOB|nr:hypothetical protein [Primorskyibacter sedentarius]TCS51300.1 hypothetical protein EDD52_1428 [Primorskyibacter sedentarius]